MVRLLALLALLAGGCVIWPSSGGPVLTGIELVASAVIVVPITTPILLRLRFAR